MNETGWETELWADIEYVARFNPHRLPDGDRASYWVDFEVFELVSFPEGGGELGEYRCFGKGQRCFWDTEVYADDLDNAEVFAKGSVKFDGQSFWQFPEGANVYGMRGCGRFTEMINRVFLKARSYVGERFFD